MSDHHRWRHQWQRLNLRLTGIHFAARRYRVGCHTSPHLLSLNERARVDGEMLSDEALLPHFEAVERARHAFAEPVSLTYFEFTVLAILHSFAARALDAVILEVGL